MSGASFPFERSPSRIFGWVWRPIAAVNFWSHRLKEWQEVIGIVDTGADYTLLPRFYADDFGIDVKADCRRQITNGIGGKETVFIHPEMRVHFLGKKFKIPVGFIDRDDLPPVLGWKKFLEKFKITLHRQKVRFEC